MAEKDRGRRRVLVGTVVSDRMQKTRIVEVKQLTRHPRYEKRVYRTLRVACHDENEQSRVGDVVEMMETRPLSRTKRWRLVRIVRSAQEA